MAMEARSNDDLEALKKSKSEEERGGRRGKYTRGRGGGVAVVEVPPAAVEAPSNDGVEALRAQLAESLRDQLRLVIEIETTRTGKPIMLSDIPGAWARTYGKQWRKPKQGLLKLLQHMDIFEMQNTPGTIRWSVALKMERGDAPSELRSPVTTETKAWVRLRKSVD